MQKVAMICDGNHFSEGAFKMAKLIQAQQPILLTGVFLGTEIYNFAQIDEGLIGTRLTLELVQEEEILVKQSVSRFIQLCDKYSFEYRIHEDWHSISMEAFVKETRYADLVIIGSEVFYSHLDNDQPNAYLREALHSAECPVLLVPEEFRDIENLILTFDGKDSSVYAIKQFAQILPEQCSKETLLVYASTDEREIPDLPYIEELTARHFPNATIAKLNFDPHDHFSAWLGGQQNSLVIAGSYKRSAFSQIFRDSFITEAIKNHKLPVFIAHS